MESCEKEQEQQGEEASRPKWKRKMTVRAHCYLDLLLHLKGRHKA